MLFNSTTDEHATRDHHALTALVQQEADRRGTISFARFMELALYAPALGFYERTGKGIGLQGDFFTSVSVGPMFGELLACQFEAWLAELRTSHPTIVEAGAHDGRLAADILRALHTRNPALATATEYWIVEPSPARTAWQEETLRGFPGRVRWFQSWTKLSSFCALQGQGLTGIIFANELLDAMPVHRITWDKARARWFELGVKLDGGQLCWAPMELSAEAQDYGRTISELPSNEAGDLLWPCLPDELLSVLPDQFTTEICPGALSWWRETAENLSRGWLLTIDYGLGGAEFFAPHRNQGTARAYFRHQLVENLLARPGEQDLTAHVNFSAIRRSGEAAGLKTRFLRDQATLLTQIAARNWSGSGSTMSAAQLRQFHTLTHPDHLGRPFWALVQSRGITPGE